MKARLKKFVHTIEIEETSSPSPPFLFLSPSSSPHLSLLIFLSSSSSSPPPSSFRTLSHPVPTQASSEFFTTPTFAALNTLPCSVKPLLCVRIISPSSLPSTLTINVASSHLGSNFLPASTGSNRSMPCFFNVVIRIDSVMVRPAWRLMRS